MCAAGGGVEQNVSFLHLDQRGEDRRPGAGGTATEQGVQEPGGKIRGDGRRCGRHIFRQYEGTVDLQPRGLHLCTHTSQHPSPCKPFL